MPAAMPTVDQVRQLPTMLQITVPSAWQDINGHVNVQHYTELYDDAGWPLFTSMGIDAQRIEREGIGYFDLEHHTWFLAEMHVGDVVSVYTRLLALSTKRIHGVTFIVNDSRGALAITNDPCTLELERVLGYPEIAAKAAGEATLSAYRSLTTRHDALQRSGQLPRCRDPDDQKFLELARDASAHYLVTKDKALLVLAKRRSAPLGFRIVTPARLAGLIATSS